MEPRSCLLGTTGRARLSCTGQGWQTAARLQVQAPRDPSLVVLHGWTPSGQWAAAFLPGLPHLAGVDSELLLEEGKRVVVGRTCHRCHQGQRPGPGVWVPSPLLSISVPGAPNPRGVRISEQIGVHGAALE